MSKENNASRIRIRVGQPTDESLRSLIKMIDFNLHTSYKFMKERSRKMLKGSLISALCRKRLEEAGSCTRCNRFACRFNLVECNHHSVNTVTDFLSLAGN